MCPHRCFCSWDTGCGDWSPSRCMGARTWDEYRRVFAESYLDHHAMYSGTGRYQSTDLTTALVQTILYELLRWWEQIWGTIMDSKNTRWPGKEGASIIRGPWIHESYIGFCGQRSGNGEAWQRNLEVCGGPGWIRILRVINDKRERE